MWRGGDVVRQTVARKIQRVDGRDHIRRIKPGVLVVGILLVNFERDCFRHAFGKVRTAAVLKGEKFAASGRIGRGIIILNETACAAHHVKPHQFAPVVNVFAFLKRRQRTHGALMTAEEFGFADVAQQSFRADAQILVLCHKQP